MSVLVTGGTLGMAANDGIVAVDTSLGVVPAGNPYNGLVALVDSEELYIYETSADGKTLRVIRGINGSTAAVHANGATIALVGSGRQSSVPTKAGIPSDADYNAAALPPIGSVVYDTTNSKLSVRHGAGSWKQTAALA